MYLPYRYLFFLHSYRQGFELIPSRYSLFLILYPVGIGSEWWLMFQALRVTNSIPVQALFIFFLFLYGPGEFFFPLTPIDIGV